MNMQDPARLLTAKTLSEALPYMQRYDGKWVVVKYGGHAMGVPKAVENFAADITLIGQLGVNPVVVHGGGPQIGAMLERLGVKTSFQDGLRVTDESAMEVVEMVLVGAIGTSIVAAINAAGGRAVGLSGVDAHMIRATKTRRLTRDPDSNLERVVDIGLVGSPERVDISVLAVLAEAGFIPVIAPIGMGADGRRYNINADEAAGAIASALHADRLILMTDVDGVLDQHGELIREVGPDQARKLIDDGVATGGMIPKLRTALEATKNRVGGVVIVNGTMPHALLTELFSAYGAGTLIARGDQSSCAHPHHNGAQT